MREGVIFGTGGARTHTQSEREREVREEVRE